MNRWNLALSFVCLLLAAALVAVWTSSKKQFELLADKTRKPRSELALPIRSQRTRKNLPQVPAWRDRAREVVSAFCRAAEERV